MFVKRSWNACCLVGAVLATAQGCGGPAYEYDAVVTGTVTIDGELANSGTVAFHPVDKGRLAIGRIHSNGSYSLRTGQGDLSQVDGGTVMCGEYLVTASITAPPVEGAVLVEGGPPIAGPSLIASKYRQKDTTDLRFTVKPGPQVIVLNLDRAEPQPPADEDGEVEAAAEAEDALPAAESRIGENIDPAGDAAETDSADEKAAAPGEQAENLERLAP